MKFILLLILLTASIDGYTRTRADTLTIINTGPDCSIRGMSIPNPNSHVIWLSGSNGRVARSADGGKTWKWMLIAGYEKTDFRDIHAFDSDRAIIMGIGNPAYILKTRDGGQSWKLVYMKNTAGMFLDAMDFRNDREGICIGDPLDAGGGRRKFFVIRTKDGGATWQREAPDSLPPAQEGEAVFSASGTNIALLDSSDYDYAFISGGFASNLYLIGRKGRPNRIYPLCMAKGTESSGAFSMATDRRKRFYCIGGDYKAPESAKGPFTWTIDEGKNWQTPCRTAPSGYRSCVSIIEDRRPVACGSNGVDMCDELGKWRRISAEGFNVCMVSPDGKLVFLVVGRGRLGCLGFESMTYLEDSS